MEKLKKALIQFAHSNPSLFPNDAGNSYPVMIEKCFPRYFSDFQTPNHPPYAAMIYRAIWELNKKRGSSEESISEHIKKAYADLPWAHSTLLKHHLKKLCDRQEVVMTNKQCYLLAGAESESGKKSNGPGKKRKNQTGQSGSDGGKKSSRPYKKSKKNEKSGSGIQKTSDKEQIELHKRKRKYKSKMKSSKCAKKHALNEETKSHEPNLPLEVYTGEIQIQELNEVNRESDHNKPMIELLKPVSLKVIPWFPDDELTTVPISIQVQDPISYQQTGKLPLDDKFKYKRRNRRTEVKSQQSAKELTSQFPDEEPPTDPISSQQDQQPEMLLIDDKPKQKRRGRPPKPKKPKKSKAKSQQSAKELTSQFPDDEPTADPISSHQDQQPEKLLLEDKPKCKRRGRPPKPKQSEKSKVKSQPSAEQVIPRFPDDEPTALVSFPQDQPPEKLLLEDKSKCKRRGRPPKSMEPEKSKVKSQRLVNNCKVGNKKGISKNKGHGKHNMTRRSD